MIKRAIAITAIALLLAAIPAQTLTFRWYPNESTFEFAEARIPIVDVIRQATGREVREQLTTDYTTASGSLNDAKYYSMIGVLAKRAEEFKEGGAFSLDTLRQKRFTFVSNASTSGFRVPAAVARQPLRRHHR